MKQQTERKSNWKKFKEYSASAATWIYNKGEDHWFLSWAILALSGIWYSLVLAFLGEDWKLIVYTANNNRRLSWFGWIITVFLLVLTSAVQLASKYHATHDENKEKLQEESAAADLYYGICTGKAKVNSSQETSYIARIERLTNHSDIASSVSYNPCAQIERITEELRTTLMTMVSDRGARFNNDLYIGVAYNLPLVDDKKWKWCKNLREKGLCIEDVMSPNSSFYQLVKDGRCEKRVFYNSKDQAAKEGLYMPDTEDVIDPQTRELQGSIACYSIELKKSDITYIRIAIGISSYRNQFVSKELLPPDWKNEDLKNCPFISNVDFVVEQYAALLRVELCKFYINKLLPNVEGVVY